MRMFERALFLGAGGERMCMLLLYLFIDCFCLCIYCGIVSPPLRSMFMYQS